MAVKKEITYYVNDDGCHICNSHKPSIYGYCYIHYDYKRTRVHRYIYELNFGKIPEGLIVRHKCDNKMCINPKHLELGTNYDNTQDMILRGGIANGERQGNSKLTEKQVRDIKFDKETKLKILAEKYDTSVQNISMIRNNKNWKHII